MLLPAEKFLIA